MAKKSNKNLIIIIGLLLLVGYVYFKTDLITNLTSGGGGPGSTQSAVSQGEDISVHFADANKNEVQLIAPPTMSIVTIGSGAQQTGVYYMRFDFNITNGPNYPKDVRITNVQFVDVNNVPLANSLQTATQAALSCVLNKDYPVDRSQSVLINTNPAGEPCNDNAWLDTVQFESAANPITLIATISANYSIFGIVKTQTVTKNITMSITNEVGGQGGALGFTILGSTKQALSECVANPAETTFCTSNQNGVCAGVIETCQWNLDPDHTQGIWPGCSYGAYGEWYAEGYERAGNAKYNGYQLCTDGRDNDCDGTIDKYDFNMATPGPYCPSGNCDTDCPVGIVFSRTNYPQTTPLTPETYTQFSTGSYWLSVNNGTTGGPIVTKMTNYGLDLLNSKQYASVNSGNLADCKAAIATNPGTNGVFIGTTPGGISISRLASNQHKVFLWFKNPVQYQSSYWCDRVTMTDSSTYPRCNTIDCITVTPEGPYYSNHQEMILNYTYAGNMITYP